MLTNHQRAHYYSLRRKWPAWPAHKAYHDAQAFDGRCYAESPWRRRTVYSKQPDNPTHYWVEDTSDLRHVGHISDVASTHYWGLIGYHVDNHYGELNEPHVWQLPARNGQPRYVYGYVDPYNDGAAYIDFDCVDDALAAAHNAQSLAERHAEREREYQAASSAGLRYLELGEQIAEERRNLLTALTERRKVPAADVPALCAMLRRHVGQVLSCIHDARQEREALTQGDYSTPFNPYNDNLRAAFNDSAGETVI